MRTCRRWDGNRGDAAYRRVAPRPRRIPPAGHPMMTTSRRSPVPRPCSAGDRVGLTRPRLPQVGGVSPPAGDRPCWRSQDDRLLLRAQHLDDTLSSVPSPTVASRYDRVQRVTAISTCSATRRSGLPSISQPPVITSVKSPGPLSGVNGRASRRACPGQRPRGDPR